MSKSSNHQHKTSLKPSNITIKKRTHSLTSAENKHTQFIISIWYVKMNQFRNNINLHKFIYIHSIELDKIYYREFNYKI